MKETDWSVPSNQVTVITEPIELDGSQERQDEPIIEKKSSRSKLNQFKADIKNNKSKFKEFKLPDPNDRHTEQNIIKVVTHDKN